MLKTVLLTSLAFTVPLVAIRFLGGFEGLELGAYDSFVRRRPADGPDNRIVVMTISDSDIEELQQYPIHDGTLAQALDKLASAEPRAIGLDISRDVPHGPAAGRKQLAQVIKEHESIVTGCLLSTENHPGSPPAPGSQEGGIGFADLPIDADGVVRRVRLISTPARFKKPTRSQHLCNDTDPSNEVPSLSFQLAVIYLAGANTDPISTENKEIQFRQQVLNRIDPRFGGYAHADVNDYQLMLNYRGAKQIFREFSIQDVLQNRVNPDSIRDRVVLVGYASAVSKDELSTPYNETDRDSRQMLGVVVHAQAVSQILSAVLDQRPLLQSWPDLAEVGWIWVWALGSGWIAFYNRRLGWFLLGLGVTGAALVGGCYALFVYQGLWVPLVPTLFTLVLTAIGVRLVDVADRSGYAQALYQQLREQMQGQTAGRDRKGDYLENLVRRARAVRQGQQAAELLAQEGEPLPNMTSEMKALYNQIATQVKKDLEAEQAAKQTAQQATTTHQWQQSNKASRIQSLLNRAQRSRTQTPPSQPDATGTHRPPDFHE